MSSTKATDLITGDEGSREGAASKDSCTGETIWAYIGVGDMKVSYRANGGSDTKRHSERDNKRERVETGHSCTTASGKYVGHRRKECVPTMGSTDGLTAGLYTSQEWQRAAQMQKSTKQIPELVFTNMAIFATSEARTL